MKLSIVAALILASCGPDISTYGQITQEVKKPKKHDAGTVIPDAGQLAHSGLEASGSAYGAPSTSFSISSTQNIYISWYGVLGPSGQASTLEVFSPGFNAYVVYYSAVQNGVSLFMLPVSGTYITQYDMLGIWTANAYTIGQNESISFSLVQ